MVRSIVVFGAPVGIPQIMKVVPPGLIIALVGAEIRPDQHDELRCVARDYGIPVLLQPRRGASTYPAFESQLRALAPDLILVNSYSMRLGPELLAIPRFGAVNVHGGLLPEYRGSNPIQWVLLNGGTEAGVTMHYVTADIDAGDIIAQRRVPIYFEDTWREIQARLESAAEAMLAEEIPKLLAGSNTRQPQDESRARYFKRRTPEDGRIDWRWSVLFIYNLVRALVKPHPGAFYFTGSRKVVLDEYLTIARVAELKYHPKEGGQQLASDRVVLTPISEEDLPFISEFFRGHCYLPVEASDYPTHDDQPPTWFERIRGRNDVVVFGIRLYETNGLIGACQLNNIDYIRCRGEAQIGFHEAALGGDQIVMESMQLLLDFAFRELNLKEVNLYATDTFGVALRVCEGLGFVRQGRMHKVTPRTGAVVDLLMMRLLRDEYAGR